MQVPVLPRIAQGDASAVDECLDRYGGLVWSLASRFHRTTADAEDAAQEIFIDLWRNAWRYKEELGSELTFVSILARRRLIDRRRRTQREPKKASVALELIPTLAASGSSSLEQTEDLRRAVGCLEGLNDRERNAVELAVYGGLSQSMIAGRINAPLGSVKTIIRRALQQLRDCMQLAKRTQRAGSIAS